MTEIIDLNDRYEEAIERTVSALKEGKLIIYPTDTVYGIGCDATNESAVNKLYKVKERNRDKPLSVLVGGLGQIIKYFDINGEELMYITKYLPGPYTFILKTKREMPVSKNDKIGVRVPNYVFIRKVALKLGRPIVTTSANISGKNPPKSIYELDEIKDRADLIINGGTTKEQLPSTVVDIRERKIIRVGAGPFEF